MLPFFVLGIALLIGLLLIGRWFVNADPKTLVRTLKWLSLGILLVIILSLAITGRLAWAAMALPAVLPWIMRARAVHRAAKNFSRMSGAFGGGGSGSGAAGQTSKIETRFLRMTLDHGSGEMNGEVTEGDYAGRPLDELSLAELVDLLNTCSVHDNQSAQVLEAYLDRVHPDWRERVQAAGAGSGSGGGRGGGGRGEAPGAGGVMSREEAFEVLGLEPGATEEEIKATYHRLIANLHPDHGGSTYLAAKINQAKDTLLRS